MKAAVWAALFASSVVAAQELPPADLSKAVPVSSPNRTQFSSVGAGTLRYAGPARSPTTALMVVDSAGKAIGRFVPEPNADGAMFVPYGGDLMFVRLAGRTNSGSFSGHLDWQISNAWTWYTSSDCTGTPYLGLAHAAARFAGQAVRDQSGTFMLIVESSSAAYQNVLSSYDAGQSQCSATNTTILVAPVIASVPLSKFAAEGPLYLK